LLQKPIQLVVLISGGGSNLQAIIDHIKEDRLEAKIRAVISNREDAYGLKRAALAGLTTQGIADSDFASRHHHEEALIEAIQTYRPDLIVLAGYMRILSSSFIGRFAGKVINIHPSLLPKFKGLNTHQRAIDAGEKIHGATVHFVTSELDGGPVILQSSVAVSSVDTAETLQKKVLEREHVIYAKAIQWFADGKIKMIDNKLIRTDDQKSPTQSY